jgi:hypothetical protein
MMLRPGGVPLRDVRGVLHVSVPAVPPPGPVHHHGRGAHEPAAHLLPHQEPLLRPERAAAALGGGCTS